MLNEPSVLSSGQASPAVVETPAPAHAQESTYEPFASAVAEVMTVYHVDYQPAPPASISYSGQLKVDSETAYDQLDRVFAAQNHHVLLTTNEEGQHVIIALKGRVNPKPRPLWPNAVLLGLTILTLLFTGADQSFKIWRGLPYAISVLLILGAHEMGHYFAARRHNVSVTLPYFIPMPLSFFGTLGAFIQLREPMRNRKVLFDVGVAGPLAGLVFAVPILMIGLATSKVEPLPQNEPYAMEGNSLFYAAAKYTIFGELLPSNNKDVFINQLAKAGWTGLFITGLNLIPLGQLDGGHVVLTLLGRRVQYLYFPIVTAFLILSFTNSMWLLWTLLLFFLGRIYAVPMDTVTELDRRRRWIGYAAMVIFVLVFVPDPLRLVNP
jgi:Zn-dependent protease